MYQDTQLVTGNMKGSISFRGGSGVHKCGFLSDMGIAAVTLFQKDE